MSTGKLSVTRHTRICCKHFEGGLGPTKASPIPTIFEFCISQPSVSKIFTTWITLLYHVFKQVLVRWPSEQLIKKYLPKCFSKYPRKRVIFYCTEIKVEKPNAPSSQKVTWSDYKSHNTFKLLVGITPSGAFSFISDLYSGAISDRAITIKSGLLHGTVRAHG